MKNGESQNRVAGEAVKKLVVVCPGIHEAGLTDGFLQGMQELLGGAVEQWLIFPTDRYPAYSGFHVMGFLEERLAISITHDWQSSNPQANQQPAIAFIGFSAGVVAAMAGAVGWQLRGGTVRSLIALDGWGVPLVGNFPIHRVSHDYFTHWSSALLGAGQESFYADPGVEHLDLWRSPQQVQGKRNFAFHTSVTTAAQFIADCLLRDGCDH